MFCLTITVEGVAKLFQLELNCCLLTLTLKCRLTETEFSAQKQLIVQDEHKRRHCRISSLEFLISSRTLSEETVCICMREATKIQKPLFFFFFFQNADPKIASAPPPNFSFSFLFASSFFPHPAFSLEPFSLPPHNNRGDGSKIPCYFSLLLRLYTLCFNKRGSVSGEIPTNLAETTILMKMTSEHVFCLFNN